MKESVASRTDTLQKPKKTSNVRRKRKFRKEWIICWIVIALPFIGYIIFNFFPVGVSIASMFTDIEHNQISTMKWNDFAHFKTFFQDGKYLHALGITLWLTCAQFVSLGIALLMATLISTNVKGSKIFQILYFIPYICSTVAVSIIWNWIFAGETGVLNSILGTNIDWRNDARTLTWCIFAVIVWQSPSYGIVMLVAAIKGIDQSLYEAAQIDGANAWKKYWHITIPQIAPMLLFLALAGWQSGMATFDAAKVMAPLDWTGVAGIENMGLTISYYSYIQGMSFSHMDYASVINWITAIIIFIGAFLFLKWRKRTEDNLE